MPAGAAFNIMAPADGFVHTTTDENVVEHWTVLNGLRDHHPDDILLVTAHYNPSGRRGTYHVHAVGVAWIDERWVIFNEDRSAMRPGVSFNVWIAGRIPPGRSPRDEG